VSQQKAVLVGDLRPGAEPQRPREDGPSLKTSLKNHALAGLAAYALLGLIELVDLNFRSSGFTSIGDRLAFAAYFSVNLVVGLAAGFSLGLETRIYMVITQDGLKMIYNWSHYAFELYDLKNDRYEQRNLYDSLPEKAGQMKRLLGRFVDVTQVSRPWDADDSKHSVGRELKQRSAYE